MNTTESTGAVALVTGAAGGIGGAVVDALAQRGVCVAAVDRDADTLQTRVSAMRDAGLPVAGVPADVTSAAAVTRAVNRIERDLGPIEFLVNAAGVLQPGPVRHTSDDAWASTFAVNATGVFLVSRSVADRMVPRGRGAIVTVGSNAAGTARTDMAAYAAAKAAAVVFTKCLGLELARHNIRCNVVSPGSTDTAMLRALNGDGDVTSSIDGMPGAFRVGIPLGKLARTDDVAEAVLFLLSAQAGHITMHDLIVDGGAGLGV